MFTKVLVPIDGSKLSLKSVQYAASLTKGTSIQTVVMHVRPVEPAVVMGEGVLMNMEDLADFDTNAQIESDVFLAAARDVIGSVGVSYRSERSDLPWKSIIDVAEAEGCDLIVMTSYWFRDVISCLLGSETQKVLSNTKTPVLVIR